MISKEGVKHIAKLARLELTQKETEKMQKDLSAILGYFDLLKKAPKSSVKEPVFDLSKQTYSVRKDEAMDRNHSLAEKIIKAFPNKKDDYIKVKTIL